jgi:hypothetical protein
MKYCVVKDGVISNIIICETDKIASEFGALPSYESAVIGDVYSPPELPEPPQPEPTPSTDERIATLEQENKLLTQQVDALSSQNDFQEELIVELANIVYA